jgi:hypothetical protein
MGYPAFMRSLVIDGCDPLLWLMEQREFWQYRCGRFPDPNLPRILDQFDVGKAQRFLAAYAADNSGIYLSDPAHAVVALPFRLVTWSLSIEPLQGTSVCDAEDIAHLLKRCLVGRQMLTSLSRYFDV